MNLLVIGSESNIAKAYISNYQSKYKSIIKTDFVELDTKDDYYLKLKLNSNDDFSELSQFIKKKYIKIDQIIFASGINFMNSFYSVTYEQWNSTISVNLTSFLFILKEIFDLLSNDVSIVFLASQNGVVAHEKRIDYGVSKAGLIHLVKLLSVEFSSNKEKNIRINAVSPSYVKNINTQEYLDSWQGKKLLSRIPYKKFVETEDVTEAIRFLLSNKSKSICGQNLILDYGYTII